jgi:ABC-type multidrug transport system ATPase subunit
MYNGPMQVCQPMNNQSLPNSWCQYSNPYSSQPQLLFPSSLTSIELPSEYWCEQLISSTSDSDICKSIVSIRALDIDNMMLKARLVLFASLKNTIYVLKYADVNLPQMFELQVPIPTTTTTAIEDDVEITSMEVYVEGVGAALPVYHLMVGQKTKQQQHSLQMFQIVLPGTLKLQWSITMDTIIDWKIIQTDSIPPAIAVLTPKFLQFYTLSGQKSCTMNIKASTQDPILGFDWFYQYGHFNTWEDKYKKSFPIRIPSTLSNVDIIRKRLIVLMYDKSQIRMFHIGSLQNGDGDKCISSMDFSDKKSDNTQKSLLYTTTDSITTVKVNPSTIRYPVISGDQVSCNSVQFTPSQQVYLYIGVSHNVTLSSLETIHIEELSRVDFAQVDTICSDSTQPNLSNECVFNPALRPKGYQFENCETCAQHSERYNKRIEIIDSRFIDVPGLINLTSSYDDDGYLNSQIICEAIGQLEPVNKQLMDNCLYSISLLTGNCEAEMFSLHSSILTPFFESYWQDNLFVVIDDKYREIESALPMIKPSSLFILGKTIYMSPDETFGEYQLSVINEMTFIGKVLDLFVSQNGHHIYASLSRLKYELLSLIRFQEICEILVVSPDNIFLQRFKLYCSIFAPSPVDIRQFGMLTSSCSNGILCDSFASSKVESDVLPGYFIFNHLTQVKCVPGTYCTHGTINMCPLGYQCGHEGLAAPMPCSAKEGSDQTCFASPLSPLPCPYGAICPTSDQPPILAPPGYAIWIENELGRITKEFRICEEGDYCPLADQVSDVSNTILAMDQIISRYRIQKQQVLEEEEQYVDDTDPSNVLLCPPNLYCTNTTILFPMACIPYNDSTTGNIIMPYCPAGSISENSCPAGFYCPDPADVRNCSRTEYCPPGSIIPGVCDSGYYCPTPAVRIRCPKGYFCREGSTSPQHCSFLGYCPEGSTKDSLTVLAIIVIVLIILLIVFCYVSFRIYSFLYQKMSRKQRLMEVEAKERRNQIKHHRSQITINAKRSTTDEASPLLLQQQQQQQHPVDSESEMESDLESHSKVELMHPTFYADIQFEELGLTVRSTGKRVLHGVTGEIRHGELTCVMGLSGAGKSTFITTLAGRAHYGIPEGIIRVNGVERNLTSFNRRVGFVPQDDIMCRDCTVEETLYFAAKTRLDRRTPASQITRIVNNVIRVLRLEDIRHSLIGDETNRGISGGQRKRVNVGIELVAQPVILFCDEPTSGLDSASSKEVCEVLQDIANSGITVITVIHQPRFEIFDMFEQLLLLGKGGKTCYLGPVKQVKQYFEKLGFLFPAQVNVADYLMDITAGNALPHNYSHFFDPYVPEQLQEKWKDYDNNGNRQNVVPVQQHVQQPQEQPQQQQQQEQQFVNPSISIFRQFWMCFTRSLTQQIRGIGNLMQDFFLVFICGLFVGLIFYNKSYVGPVDKTISNKCPAVLQALCEMPLDDPIFKVSSMMNLAMSLTGVMASLKVFGKEKVVFMRESQTGLSSLCFFWSKDLASLPLNIFAPWIFLVMYYTLIGPRAQVYEVYYVLFLTYYTSYGLGYLVSIVINPINAQLFAVVIVFILNVFSGSTTTLREFKEMTPPMNILPYCSYLSFGLETGYLLELRYYKNIYNINKSMSLFGYQFKDLHWMWGAMLAYGVGFRVLAYIALWCSRPDSLVVLIKNTITNWTLVRVKNTINRVSRVKVSIDNSN